MPDPLVFADPAFPVQFEGTFSAECCSRRTEPCIVLGHQEHPRSQDSGGPGICSLFLVVAVTVTLCVTVTHNYKRDGVGRFALCILYTFKNAGLLQHIAAVLSHKDKYHRNEFCAVLFSLLGRLHRFEHCGIHGKGSTLEFLDLWSYIGIRQ